MDKYFICDYARGDWGKTSVLLKVIEKLGKPIDTILKSGDDCFAYYSINGKTVAVITQGDPDSKQKEWLMMAVGKNVDIVVCAARAKGDTLDNVRKILKNYNEILFRNFHFERTSTHIDEANSIMADAVVLLINKLCI